MKLVTTVTYPPKQWQHLNGQWADQTRLSKENRPQLLIGADASSLFPVAVSNSEGYPLQSRNVCLMRSILSGRYILFGCTDEGRNLNVTNNFPSVGSVVANAGTVVDNDCYNLSNYTALAKCYNDNEE